jgi:ArsR family transcriptional regulator
MQPIATSLDPMAALLNAVPHRPALSNPDRLLLLCQWVGGDGSASEFGVSAGIPQPSLSQQLRVLRGELLVAARRVGKQMLYRISSAAALTVLQALYGLFCEPAPASAAAHHGRPAASPASRARQKAT